MKLAVIGTGYWGSKVLATCKDIADSTGYDINDNWQTADFDVAVVCTPAETHYDVAKTCLEQGKHVLVEKPVADNKDNINDLCDIALRKNLILQAGHILLFTETTRYIKEQINKDKIKFLQTRRCNFGNIPRNQIDLSMHLLVHDLALVDYIKSESLQNVTQTGSNILDTEYFDNTQTHITWQTFTSSHECSWFYPTKTRSIVVQTDKDLIYCDDNNNTVVHKQGNYNGKLELLSDNTIQLNDNSSPMHREIEHFLDCVEHMNQQGCNGIDHIQRVYQNLYIEMA